MLKTHKCHKEAKSALREGQQVQPQEINISKNPKYQHKLRDYTISMLEVIKGRIIIVNTYVYQDNKLDLQKYIIADINGEVK